MFDAKLGFVANVLVLATSTAREISARRFHAIRRGPNHPQQSSARKALFYFRDFGLNLFPYEDKRHENDKVLNSRHAFAAECYITDLQIYFLANYQIHRRKLEAALERKKDFLRTLLALFA